MEYFVVVSLVRSIFCGGETCVRESFHRLLHEYTVNIFKMGTREGTSRPTGIHSPFNLFGIKIENGGLKLYH
jgi:hypothetical protein